MHPDRYKTSLCERGSSCNRPICFFAHTEEELRPLPQGLQRTKPVHRSAGAESSRSASSRQQAADGQLQSDVVYVVGHAGHAQGDIQLQAEQGLAAQLQQQVDYVPVVQQAPGVPYPAAFPSQQQQLVQPQGGLRSGLPASPSFMLAQPAMYSSGSHISQQQTPETSADTSLTRSQPAPLLGTEVHHAPQTAYNTTSMMHPTQPPYMPPPQADRPFQGAPIGQVLIGYHPVQGYGGPQGVIMVRPGAQRGSTVAVIPAGPSTWAQSGLGAAAETGDAPSLEDLCAAMSQLAVPPPAGPSPESQLQQYATEGDQQQDPLLLMGQQQVVQQPMQLQPQMPVFMAASPVPQQLQLAGTLQPQPFPQLVQQPVLPGQPVMLMVNPDGTTGSVAPVPGGWPGIGPGI